MEGLPITTQPCATPLLEEGRKGREALEDALAEPNPHAVRDTHLQR
jgi:hypothetical protein